MRTGRSVAIGDHQIGVVVGLQQLIVGVERVGLAWAVEGAFRQIDIRLAERGPHVLEVDAAGCQSLRIELHADGGLLLTADTHQTNAGYLRYLLQQDIFRKSIDGGQRQAVRGKPKHQDRRVGRLTFRIVGGYGKPTGNCAAAALMADSVSLTVPSIWRFKSNCRVIWVKPSALADVILGEARDLAELQFEWCGDRRRHGLRIGARQLGP